MLRRARREFDCVCTRGVGHIGKHVPVARDAWLADRYANTSGVRHLRRCKGYRHCPPLRVRLERKARLRQLLEQIGESRPLPAPPG